MMRIARGMAVLGGAMLSLLIGLTCVSIIGRLLNSLFHSAFMQEFAPALSERALNLGIGPITGDFELVEAGVAFAIFAFLPLCQITAGHASVDILTNRFSAGLNRFLRMVFDVIFALVLILIAWRLSEGMLSKRNNAETSFLLQFPIWWAYAASFTASAVAALAGTYVAWVRVTEFVTGRIIMWDGVEADQ